MNMTKIKKGTLAIGASLFMSGVAAAGCGTAIYCNSAVVAPVTFAQPAPSTISVTSAMPMTIGSTGCGGTAIMTGCAPMAVSSGCMTACAPAYTESYIRVVRPVVKVHYPVPVPIMTTQVMVPTPVMMARPMTVQTVMAPSPCQAMTVVTYTMRPSC